MKSIWVKTSKVKDEIEEKLRGYLENTPAATLTALEVHILAALYEQDDQQVGILARTVGRAATSFTPPLDRLQGKGLLMRREDKVDRRVVFIYLTDKGEALRPHVLAAVEKLNSEFYVLIAKHDVDKHTYQPA